MTEYENMELKYNFSAPENNSAELNLFMEFFKLKALYRQGWLKAGIKKEKCESVAEHSFMVALISIFLAEKKGLDTLKATKMALVHEAGEISAGDITPCDKVSEEDKQTKERECVNKLFSKLENASDYIKLWEEFENQNSREAQLVKQVDSLELVLQAKIYEKIQDKDLGDFFTSAEKKIYDSSINNFLQKIKKI